MGNLNQDNNFRREFSKDISKLMKKKKREEQVSSAEAAKAQKVMEVEGSSTSVRASKIGRTSDTIMKNPTKEKEHAKEFEYNTDYDQDYVDYLRTYDEEVHQV